MVPEHFERGSRVHDRRSPQGHRRQPLPGLHSRPGSRPAGQLRARTRRLRARQSSILLPSAKLLMAPECRPPPSSWRRQEQRCTSPTSRVARLSRPGPGCHGSRELFGIRHKLRYGLTDSVKTDQVTLTFVEDLGEALTTGTQLNFHVAGSEGDGRSCPSSRGGRQFWRSTTRAVRRCYDAGWACGAMILCTYPIEHMALGRRTRTRRTVGGSIRHWPAPPASSCH